MNFGFDETLTIGKTVAADGRAVVEEVDLKRQRPV